MKDYAIVTVKFQIPGKEYPLMASNYVSMKMLREAQYPRSLLNAYFTSLGDMVSDQLLQDLSATLPEQDLFS